ncbi:hypothetical protein TUM17384_10210 [Shewanella algae]|nr:hypothetical protein TUM17384_10210 [Shewanella algae]
MLGLFCLSRFQRARLNMQPKAAGAVCAPQLAAKLLRATAIYQAVLDEQMSFAPHVRWCCGDIENRLTRLSGQIYPVSGAQRLHPTGILNKGTRGLSKEAT